MKNLKLILSALLLSSQALAAQYIDVNCTAPENFMGNTATISGKIKVESRKNGPSEAKGILRIELDGPSNYKSTGEQFNGQFDDTAEHEDSLFTGRTAIEKKGDGMRVVANFTRTHLSEVQYRGVTYKMNCNELAD